MMRKLFVFVMVAGLVGLGGFVRDARAGATIDLLFVELNGAAIAPTNVLNDVAPGDVIKMAARMTNDQALTAAIFSLNYDLDGTDDLDVLSIFQWTGVLIAGKANFKAVGPLSTTTPTFAGSFQGFTTQVSPVKTLPPAGGNFAGGYQMGTVTWQAAPTAADFTTIISGILNFGVDAFGDDGFNNIDNLVLFRTARVNFIPEPGTAALLGLGLVGLVLVGRRSRS